MSSFEREVRAQISLSEKKIAEIEDEEEEVLESAKRRLSELKCRKEVLAASMEEEKSLLAKLLLDRMPPEVLGIIFECALEGYNRTSPWTLAKICRAWRFTLFNTPRVWSSVCITRFSTPIGGHGVRCLKRAAIERVLTHARSAPLSIRISTGDHRRGAENPEFWQMVECLGGRRMHHWQHFDLSYQEEETAKWEQYFEHPAATLPLLRSLTVHRPPESLLHLMRRTSRHVKTLDCSVTAEQLSTFIGAQWLQSIEHIDLYKWDSSRGLDEKEIFPLLASLPRITTLSTSVEGHSAVHDRRLSLPSGLRKLAISGCGFICFSLFAPSLVSLRIYLNEPLPTKNILQPVILLPCLEELASLSEWALFAISVLQCPKLRTLEISPPTAEDWNGKGPKHFLACLRAGICRMDPTSATFEVANLDTTFLEIIACFPKIRKRSISYSGPRFWKPFYDQESTPICQELEELEVSLNLNMGERFSWEDYVLEVRRMARQRLRLGLPLKEFCLDCGCDDYWLMVDIWKTRNSARVPSLPRDDASSERGFSP